MKPNLVQLRRLVGNPDAYAEQYLTDDGVAYRPVRKPLTNAVLHKHLAGDITVGTYIGHKVGLEAFKLGVAPDSTVAHTLVFDIDSGGSQAAAEAQAIGLALVELGVSPSWLGTEDSGNKGYHVWLLLHADWPSADLRRVGRAALAIAGVECEVYPKQDEVRDLGNLVKLPGGIHLKTGRPNNFVDRPPAPMPIPLWTALLASLPAEQKARRAAPADNRFPCMGHIQEGVAEGGRNNQLFHLATMYRRAGVSDDLVDLAVRAVNAKSEPPLDDRELEQLLDSSRMSGPICDQLPENVRESCGEYCIRVIRKGLRIWPGDVRNGGVGECVTVRIAARDVDTVTFEHDDLKVAKGSLR